MKSVLILGSNGQLGSDLVKSFSDKDGVDLIGLTHRDIEITDKDKLWSVLSLIRPDIVINATACHNVPECEQHPAKAFAVNSIALKYLAEYCANLDSMLVHFSTDYVFAGEKDSPYIETDKPMPLNTYGNSKLAGEWYAFSGECDFYIIRVSSLFGASGCRAKNGSNFVENMIRAAQEGTPLRIVDDQIMSPTYTRELADTVFGLVVHDTRGGLYHISNDGECSWFEFAREIFELTGIVPTSLEPISRANQNNPIRTPRYSVLGTHSPQGMSHWKEALWGYLREKGYI